MPETQRGGQGLVGVVGVMEAAITVIGQGTEPRIVCVAVVTVLRMNRRQALAVAWGGVCVVSVTCLRPPDHVVVACASWCRATT